MRRAAAGAAQPVQRFAKEVREHDEAFKFLGVGYAVLLAFVVISAYTSYNDAKSGAEAEAEAVLQLSRTAEAFSPEQLERLEGAGLLRPRGDP